MKAAAGTTFPTMRLLPWVVAAILAAGCASHPESDVGRQCADGLAQADAEFNQAQAKGPGDSITLIKASALLNAARVQKEFGKYPNCVKKVERARAYIAEAAKR